MRRLCVLFVLAVLTGCASIGPEELPASLSGKKIVVVSTLGAQMNLDHFGNFVWDNEHAVHDLSKRALDPMLEENASALIAVGGRFPVQPAAHARSRELLAYVPDGPYDSLFGSGSLNDPGKVVEAARLEDAELVVLLEPGSMPDWITDNVVEGYGVLQHERFLMGSFYSVYSSLDIELYDGVTGQRVSRLSDHEFELHDDSSAWTPGEIGISPQQEEHFMRLITAMYRSLLKEGFQRIGLAPASEL